jgi:hypothetical protein
MATVLFERRAQSDVQLQTFGEAEDWSRIALEIPGEKPRW